MSLFKSQNPSVSSPTRVSGHIKIQKDGEERLLTVPQFEALTGVAFFPQLDFADFSIIQDIAEKTQKIHKKGELTREQLWLGSYYKNEILNAFFPAVTIRWIDDTIGWGVFAAKAFKKMEYVAEYCGKVRPRQREDKKNAYCFEYVITPELPTSYTIDAQDQGGIGRFINHNAKPNLHTALVTLDWINHVILIADEPIQKGAQLFYDYGPDYWSARSKPKNLDSTIETKYNLYGK